MELKSIKEHLQHLIGLGRTSHLTPVQAVPAPRLKIHTIFLETITRCNLQCTYCHRTNNNYSSKNRKMAFPLFKSIIDQLDPAHHLFCDEKAAIWLHGYGEPTLHPDLASQIAYTNQSGKFREIRIVSNLMATAKENYDGYFAAGLTHLYVSLDSLNPDVLAKTRVGSDPEKIDETFRYIVSRYPEKVRVITVLSPDNLSEIGAVYRYLSDLGVKQWVIQLMFDHAAHGFAVDSAGVRELAEILKNPSEMQVFAEGLPYPKCTQPNDTLVINVHGNIAACCTYFAEDYINLGNVKEINPLDAFVSQRFEDFRKTFEDRSHPLCKGCPMWGPN